MKINLQEVEIKSAIVEFLNNQGIDTRNKDISVVLTAGRKGNGHSAQVEILEQTAQVGAMKAVTEDSIPFSFADSE